MTDGRGREGAGGRGGWDPQLAGLLWKALVLGGF